MWSAKETARVLRGEQVTILKEWKAQAQAQLWHLDAGLFTRRGEAVKCANTILTCLIGWNEARGESEESSLEAQESTLSLIFESEKMQECASAWVSLSLVWTDIRVLLKLLIVQLQKALVRREADSETWGLQTGQLVALMATVADLYVIRLEQELDGQRGETVVTQYVARRFMTNASHDLRTPLTAVLGFTELLQEETYGVITLEQRTALGHIQNSAQNLQEIIDNMLDLFQVRTAGLELKYRTLSCVPMLQHLYEILTPLAQRKKVHFKLELSENLGTLEMDENLIRHSLYQLLSITLRATHSEGLVTLKASREGRELTLLTHINNLHLPPETVASASNPSPTIENSSKPGYETWEVGLPLVNRYIELHNGTLEIKSSPKVGTTFRILLPTNRAKE